MTLLYPGINVLLGYHGFFGIGGFAGLLPGSADAGATGFPAGFLPPGLFSRSRLSGGVPGFGKPPLCSVSITAFVLLV
jgi:hypothetical protein